MAASVSLLQHSEMNDETVQLKTLQTVLTIFQSQLHPGDEVFIKICQVSTTMLFDRRKKFTKLSKLCVNLVNDNSNFVYLSSFLFKDNMSIALGICFRLLENNNPDSVHRYVCTCPSGLVKYNNY